MTTIPPFACKRFADLAATNAQIFVDLLIRDIGNQSAVVPILSEMLFDPRLLQDDQGLLYPYWIGALEKISEAIFEKGSISLQAAFCLLRDRDSEIYASVATLGYHPCYYWLQTHPEGQLLKFFNRAPLNDQINALDVGLLIESIGVFEKITLIKGLRVPPSGTARNLVNDVEQFAIGAMPPKTGNDWISYLDRIEQSIP